MGNEDTKWLVMGIIGIIIAVVGVITLFISLFGIRNTNRIVKNYKLATILLIYAVSLLEDGTWSFMLVTQYSALIIYQRRLTVFRISLFAGICMCVFGVILAITGWLKYIQLENE